MAQTSAIETVRTVREGFAALDDALLLDKEQDRQAKDARGKIDEILTDAGWQKQSLLQGSYGRKTMLPPLKDVDLTVILPENKRYLLEDPAGSNLAMAAFRRAIVDSGEFPGILFDGDGPKAHALQMVIPGLDFTVDLVPAFETDEYDWLVIADREKCRWDKRSDVRGLRDKVVARNVLCTFKWVRQVRHAKHALRVTLTSRSWCVGSWSSRSRTTWSSPRCPRSRLPRRSSPEVWRCSTARTAAWRRRI